MESIVGQLPSRGRCAGVAVFSLYLLLHVPGARAQVRPRITQAIDDRTLVTLTGNRHPLARSEFDLGPAPPDLPAERMLLVLRPAPEQQAALAAFLGEQHDKSSPNYHKWLTPDQFGRQFGPSEADVGTVTSWLLSQGFRVDHVFTGRNLIEFSGNAAGVQRTFHTAIHRYRVQGAEHWANASDPQIPAALSPVVAGVASLHNFLARPQLAIRPDRLAATMQNGTPHVTFGAGSYALGPADYSTIYNIKPAYQSGINGSGAAVAVVGRSNIIPQDITDFRGVFGLSNNPPQIIVNGIDPGNLGGGEEVEAVLDVTWSGAVAPNAAVKFVVSKTTNVTDGVTLSEAYIIDNNLAGVMTESFGSCEAAYTASAAAAVSAMAEQAAAQGITYLVSAGDSGSAGCDDPSNSSATGPFSVNILASPPFAIGVGGTLFNDSSNYPRYWSNVNGGGFGSALSYIPENVWNESSGGGLWATGGGASIYFPKPPWQSGVAGIPVDGVRHLPDVSLTAALHDPYVLCLHRSCVPNSQGQIFFNLVGGTSAAAPSFAGVMALINQKTGTRQGQANYVLYRLAATETLASCNASETSVLPSAGCIFNDATVGTNSVPGEPGFGTPGALYPATTGYDSATGLGSVNVANLVNQWNSISFTPAKVTLSLNPTTLAVGASTNVTINVTPSSGGGTPTGDVALITSANQSIAMFTLAGGAVFSTTNQLPAGSYSVIAHYAGDAVFAPADSSPVVVSVGSTSVNLNPSSLTFANQSVATTSPAQGVTLRNTGPAALAVAGIAITGGNSGDFAQNNNCPASLAVSGTCTINVTFTPTAAGTRSAAVTITDNGSGSPQAVSLTGTGVAIVSAWPNGYTYQATFTVASGKVPATLSGFPVLISGTYADFKTQANGGKISSTCTQTVWNRALTVPCDLIFTSDPAGSVLLSWEFESYSATTGAVTMWVNVPSLTSGTTVYAWYGNSSAGTLRTIPSATWGPQFVSVWHLPEDPSGTAPQLNDSTANALNGTTQGFMTSNEQVAGQIGGAISGNGTSQYAKLAAASSTALSFERTDSWSVSCWYRTNANGSSFIVSKEGAGTPTGWAFFLRVGTANPTVALAIQNNGNSNGLNTYTTTEFPQNTWHHAVATYNGTSSTSGVTIYVDGQVQGKTDMANNLSATIVNSYIGALGNRSDGGFPTNFLKGTADEIRVYAKGTVLSANWVTAEYNNQSNPATFFAVTTGLTNTTTVPVVGLSPSSLTFGNQTVNTVSPSQGITVTNNGPGVLTITSIAIAGDYAQNNNCPASLAVSSACTINVTFTPTTTGARSGAVTITDNGTGSPQAVSMTGTGTIPAVGLSAASLSFGSQTLNTTSTAQSVTVTNNGPGVLTIASVATTGDYAQNNNCPASLAATATCTINVTFKPTVLGARSGSVTITDNGSGSPQAISLSGTGVGASWPNGYSYKATFTVAAGKASGTLSNFPVLIAGTYPDLKTVANGGKIVNTCAGVPCDLIFTSDAAGAILLSWEFESYNAATGAVNIWVNTPSLSSGTVIYGWYGNSAATTLQTLPSNTWNSNFLAVYHLKENPAGSAPQINDSTSHLNQGSTNGGMTAANQVAGEIGGSLNFNGGSYFVTLANPTSFTFEYTDSWSVSCWVKPAATPTAIYLGKQTGSAPVRGWSLKQDTAGGSNLKFGLSVANNGGSAQAFGQTAARFPTGSWYQVVATYSGTGTVAGMNLYVNGASQPVTATLDNLGGNTIVNTAAPQISGHNGANYVSTAVQDECRVYAKGTVLSPSWVATEYNNQSSPATFFTVVTGLTN